jgi:hypothetical protein
MRGPNGPLHSLFFWYWATTNGLLCSLFIILVVGNKYLAKKLLPRSFEPWTKRYLGWSSTTTLRDLSCSWQVFLLFVPFLVNCGPSPGSITTYWALSCDVLRHIVTSSIAARHRDEVDRLYVSCGGVLAGDQRLRDFFNPLQPCGG